MMRLSAREFRDEILAVDEEIEAFLGKLREENRKTAEARAKKPVDGGGKNA